MKKLITVLIPTLLAAATPAHATLVWYYDPADGQVAFDTTATRSGGILSYKLVTNQTALTQGVVPGQTLFFNEENRVFIRDNSLYFNTNVYQSEYFNGQTISGVYTIGAVLPPGLSSEEWGQFAYHSVVDPVPDELLLSPGHSYTDLRGGDVPPPGVVIYGPPPVQPRNYWSLFEAGDLTWAMSPRLLYDPSSGEVYLDNRPSDGGGFISWLWVRSSIPLLEENATDFPAATIQFVSDEQYVLVADAIDPDLYNLGAVLPIGLSVSEFQAAFADSTFIGPEGFNGAQADLILDALPVSSFALVPEPTSVALLLLVGGAARIRRCGLGKSAWNAG